MLLSEVSSFVQTVKGNTAPEVSGEEGLKALRLALNTIEAIESHKKKVTT